MAEPILEKQNTPYKKRVIIRRYEKKRRLFDCVLFKINKELHRLYTENDFGLRVQLAFLGFLGEYVMAINARVMNRPLVVEEERINFDSENSKTEE